MDHSPCRLQLLIRSVKYSGPSAMTEKYKGALVALVEPRFNAQANYLNLSKLQGIEVEGFKIDFNNLSTMRTLWSVIAQKCPTVRPLFLVSHFGLRTCGTALLKLAFRMLGQVSTINLASNRIHNLNAFKDLTNHFSGLVNLSLEVRLATSFRIDRPHCARASQCLSLHSPCRKTISPTSSSSIISSRSSCASSCWPATPSLPSLTRPLTEGSLSFLKLFDIWRPDCP